jgi:hypothetical protein
MAGKILRADFKRHEDVEKLIAEEFDIFLDRLKESQDKINKETMQVENLINDFEWIIEDLLQRYGRSKSGGEIEKYNNIMGKIRQKWNIVDT